MIALRRWAVRSRRNRWLFPVLVLILLLLALMVAFHPWGHSGEVGSAAVCVLVGFLITIVVLRFPPLVAAPTRSRRVGRDPPQLAVAALFSPSPPPVLVPLRL